jgi:hypothetical protein
MTAHLTFLSYLQSRRGRLDASGRAQRFCAVYRPNPTIDSWWHWEAATLARCAEYRVDPVDVLDDLRVTWKAWNAEQRTRADAETLGLYP